MNGYIYIIANLSYKDKNMIRVGKTKNSSLSRPKTQCSYLPFRTAWFSFKVENYTNVETSIHRYLKSYKINGDWFNYDLSKLLLYIDDNFEVMEYNFPNLKDCILR